VVVVTVVSETSALAGFAVSDVLAKPVRTAEVHSALRRLGLDGAVARTVLVVDDDPHAVELMTATLQTLGIAALVASSGMQALELLQQHEPDAMILDLLMPGMNGFDVLHALRQQPRWRTLPVFVWTSMQLSTDERTALERSVRAVIAKGDGGLGPLVEQLRAWQMQRVPQKEPK
jgi:CheY-like chemotaxis protein